MNKHFLIVLISLFCLNNNSLFAQEELRPLNGNVNLIYKVPSTPIQNNSLNKVTSLYDTLPFFEDFYYAPNSPYPSGAHWEDSSVYINTGFAKAPPSVGVASFDGLNRKGYPYNLSAQPIVSAAADTLTSRPISLFAQSGYTYSPADSVAITFLYQRAGFGENPEVNDSLILDFYKPLYTNTVTATIGQWFRVWSTRGNNSPSSTDSSFKRAFVRISDTAYFHDGFKFRFRNKATSSGSVDHWNVDYIHLKKNYFQTDTVYNEVALGYMPRPILKNYSSMPYYQYNTNEMGSKFSCFIRNNNVGVVKNTNYEYSIINAAGAVLSTYGTGASNTGNANPFVTRGWDSVATHKNPPVNYTFTPSTDLTDSTHFYVKHVVSSNPDIWKYNDTIYQRLEFNNYYAYDDGSAEMGYYLNGYGAKAALRFTLNVTDTLRALDIYFDPVVEGNLIEIATFRLYVWGDGSGEPGTVIRRDSAVKPQYLQIGHNKFPRYFFTSPMVLSPGTYYFGMVQTTNQHLNVGFDRNFDHHDALYYDVTGAWQQSQIKGSLMIHPILGSSARALVGIKENSPTTKEGLIKIYPNPASDKLHISTIDLDNRNSYSVELRSVLGNLMYSGPIESGNSELNISDYSAGLYFVVLKQNNIVLSQQKLIISK